LNRFVDSTIPLTWTNRVRFLRPSGPLVLFACLLSAEAGGLRALAEGRPVVWITVVSALWPALFFLLAAELCLRFQHCYKRKLELGPKKVTISPPRSKCNSVKWELVRAWHFEPIPGQPDLCKLGFHFLPGKRARCIVSWFMVVPSPELRSALLGKLHARLSQSPGQFRILEAKEPLEPPPRRQCAGVWLYVVGALLLLHGLGLLGLGWVAKAAAQRAHDRVYQAQPAQPDRREAPLAPAKPIQRARLMQIMRLIWPCGWGLTVSGGALFIRSVVLLNRSRRAAEAELRSYFARVGLA
jgi:hypothetical protein